MSFVNSLLTIEFKCYIIIYFHNAYHSSISSADWHNKKIVVLLILLLRPDRDLFSSDLFYPLTRMKTFPRVSQVVVKCSGNLLTSLQGADLCLSYWLGRYCPNMSNSQGTSDPNIRSTSKKSQTLNGEVLVSNMRAPRGKRLNLSISRPFCYYLSWETPAISVSLHATVKVVRCVTL